MRECACIVYKYTLCLLFLVSSFFFGMQCSGFWFPPICHLCVQRDRPRRAVRLRAVAENWFEELETHSYSHSRVSSLPVKFEAAV